jgi:hypothetical protein
MKTRYAVSIGLPAKILFTIILFALAPAPKAAAQPSGYALDFSPLYTNYVSLNLTAPPASNYTLTAWVKLRTGGANLSRMAVLSGTSCGTTVEFMIHATTDTAADPQYVELGRCSAFNGGLSSGTLPLHVWTHVAVTVSSNKVVSYFINGSSVGSWTNAALNFSLGNTVVLGANNVRQFDGQLDNFQLWTRELSAAEVQTNVTQQLTGNESGLAAWYPFNEGSGGTTTNEASAGGGSTGTLVNNPQWTTVPPIVTTVSYWRMGENDPGAFTGGTSTSTKDLIGGRDMTLIGSPIYTADFSAEASARVDSIRSLWFFPGDYGTNALIPSLTDNFGLELWVKPGTLTGNHCLAYNGHTGSSGWGLYLLGNQYQGVFGGVNYVGTATAIANTWTHLALVRDNGVATLYVNGVAAGATTTAAPNPPTGIFAVAAQPQNPALEQFSSFGYLDEIRVFTFAPGAFSTNVLLLINGQPPEATTTVATPLGSITATLNGLVNPGNFATAVWFEWGATTNYGNFTSTNILAGTTNTLAVSNNASGLSVGNTYHFRVAASTALGVSYGQNLSFSPAVFTNVPIAGLPGIAHGSVAWGDYDNDGRLDFFLTGTPDNFNGISQLWRNTGNGFTNVTASAAPDLPGVFEGSVAWGDYDNDGRLDFLLTGRTGTLGNYSGISQLWRNTGNGFTNVTASAAPGLPGVSSSSVAWGDYDNDGRLDFLLTGSYASQLWRNTGSGFTNATPSAFPNGAPLGVNASSVAWGDYDNDGRLDFLITGYYFDGAVHPMSQLWRNTGNEFTNVPIPGLPQVAYSSVAWGDYDNDGHLDFFITGISSVAISQLWRNTGNGFTNVPLPGVPGVYGGSVAWADCDNDGYLDFLLTGAINHSSGNTFSQLWRNTGSGFTKMPLPGVPDVRWSSVEWGDYDNDGRLDFLLTGANYNTTAYYAELWRNNTPVTNAPPAAPTGLALTATPNAVMLSWNSATDDFTPAIGLTYNVRAGTTPGGTDLLATHVNATNGFRRVPALGNAMLRHSLPLTGLTNGQTVYWSVQAVDTSFAGGPFAAETSVVTSPTLFLTTNSQPSTLNLSWTPPTFGWHLEETPALNPAAWTNSPSGALNPAAVTSTNPATLYRLKNQ